ncbi:MAG: hypothetical protein L3J74_17345 [Bacteroidales bacterium]|nr:hypothetical protein [Bacteroidales bacterium]
MNKNNGHIVRNEFYFSIDVLPEQIDYAEKLVNYSLKHHPVKNIWDKVKKDKTKDLRMTGTVGEIVFADLYQLKRPLRSFGAVDGQDYGQDFLLVIKNQKMIFDLKTMHRKTNIFYKDYVLNIPARNVQRADSLTDYYFCISLSEEKDKTTASIIGYLSKKDILNGEIGILYKKGSKRIRADKTYFTFFEDTYEVFFKNIHSPFISERIKKLQGFTIHHLK